MITVTVDGKEYTIEKISELTLFPLLKVFGRETVGEDESEQAKKAWESEFLGRFCDPINQAAVAYSIKSLIPDIAPEVIRYDTYRMTNGDYRVDFALNMSAMDLLELVNQLDPLLKASTEAMQTKGFAKTERKKR